MRNYQRWNNIIGWIVFAIATYVYVSTAERTTSWWDCGEYISTSFKLEVGHPPGAPTFQILGALFSHLAGGDLTKVGFMINVMSCLASSFSILFLFWTITMLGKKLLEKAYKNTVENFNIGQRIIIYGSAAVGALAYTFSDSFWFSAVEGEVYAMSSFFTAITFWAILKWEACADRPHNLRWIIFVAFMIGLAIGVHLLNLLVIPSMVYIVYYKKFQPTRKRFWAAALISGALVGLILWGIVPWTVKLAGYFELFSVNTLRLPFNVGTLIYFLLILGGLTYGIFYAIKKQRVILHTALLCLAFLLIGYSTFFTLVIRANAGVPINQNEPKNALSLLSYLNRDQYGSRPLLYGPFFNAKVIDQKDGDNKYQRNNETKRYEVIGTGAPENTFDPAFSGLFPRMHSTSDGGGRPHIQYYKFWSGTKGDVKPTMGENIRFLFRYHFDWMYFRYFMWNFAGRQNNVQGLGYNEDGSRDIFNGNWITGIKFWDEMRLGPQDNLPHHMANNQARNTFYALPLLLGLIGFWFQYKKDKHNTFVTFLLFFMTGLAIIIYLNQPSTEPRERDYAYAGSFYAFAIWIGLGVMGLYYWLSKKIPATIAASSAVAVTLVLVPGIMAKEGWDDHNRSTRTAAYDFAKNALASCEPNAILIANGDNDTFPLWYCQEVEGIRTDVRIINSALAGSYWHVQPLFRKIYDSEPVKFTLSNDQYGECVNEMLIVEDKNFGQSVELKNILKFVASEDPQTKRGYGNTQYNYIPTRKVKVSIDVQDLLRRGIITQEQALRTPPAIEWELNSRNAIYKNDLCFMDVFASNDWERPIYLMSAGSQSNVLPTPMHAQNEGSIYRVVPYFNENRVATQTRENGVATDKTYDLMVNKFAWGNLQDPKTAVDPESGAYSRATRYQYIILARALNFEGKKDSAIKALDKSLELFPHDKIPLDGIMLYQIEAYLNAGAKDKALKLANEIFGVYEHRLTYAERFPRKYKASLGREIEECYIVFDGLRRIMGVNEDLEVQEVAKRAEDLLKQRGMNI